MSEILTVDPSELLLAGLVGVMRRVASMKRGGTPKYEQEKVDRWVAEIEGAVAELVVARRTGTYWNAFVGNTKGLPDCGPYHVRHTTYKNGCLILHPGDPEAIFLLVTGRAPTLTLHGWLSTAEGRDDRYWRIVGDLPGAWFVPQGVMRPMGDLP